MQIKPDKAPLLKNAVAAPYIYFDGAPVMGVQNGIIEVELAARAVMPKPDGQVYLELVCVAHLRCSAASAVNLRDALSRALDMIEQANGATKPFDEVPAALKQ